MSVSVIVIITECIKTNTRKLFILAILFQYQRFSHNLPNIRDLRSFGEICAAQSGIAADVSGQPPNMGPIVCPETSLTIFHCTLLKILEERTEDFHLGGSLKRRVNSIHTLNNCVLYFFFCFNTFTLDLLLFSTPTNK